jgi:hypothetical protein
MNPEFRPMGRTMTRTTPTAAVAAVFLLAAACSSTGTTTTAGTTSAVTTSTAVAAATTGTTASETGSGKSFVDQLARAALPPSITTCVTDDPARPAVRCLRGRIGDHDIARVSYPTPPTMTLATNGDVMARTSAP